MKYVQKQARKPRSYASSKLRLTDSPTGVKCRATSVAKKHVVLNCIALYYADVRPHWKEEGPFNLQPQLPIYTSAFSSKRTTFKSTKYLIWQSELIKTCLTVSAPFLEKNVLLQNRLLLTSIPLDFSNIPSSLGPGWPSANGSQLQREVVKLWGIPPSCIMHPLCEISFKSFLVQKRIWIGCDDAKIFWNSPFVSVK